MTKNYFSLIRSHLLTLGFTIRHADEADGVLVVDNPALGIRNLVLGCGEPLLILEQYLLELPAPSCEVYQQLLMKNRDTIHGAFALDESGRKVIFRDTLQIDTLDLSELEAVLTSLSLLLTEFSEALIGFARGTAVPAG